MKKKKKKKSRPAQRRRAKASAQRKKPARAKKRAPEKKPAPAAKPAPEEKLVPAQKPLPAKPAEPTGKALTVAQRSLPAVPAKRRAKALRWVALAAAVLAVAGGVFWLRATTPGWHVNARTGDAYLIMEGTHSRAKGVYSYDGVRYVFGDNGLLAHGWGSCDGHTWYADSEGRLLTGVQDIDGRSYYLDPESGEFLTGFYEDDAGTTAYSELGWPLRGLCRYEGVPYYFDSDGYLQYGWIEDAQADARYYAAEDGALQTGWQTLEDATYYFDPNSCALYRDTAVIDAKRYCFDPETGAMQTDAFVRYPYGVYYAGPDGVAAMGWQEVDGRRYYFDGTARMLTGYHAIQDAHYHFGGNGALLTGFQTLDGLLYYFGEDGVIKAGSYTYAGQDRLFDETGCALEGWQKLSGSTFYYKRGIKMTGEVTIEAVKYNLGDDGILRTGWQEDSYFNNTGYKVTGFQNIDGKTYYFDQNGVLGRNITVGQYKVDANGVATKIAPAGGSVSSCYYYVRRNMRYTRIPSDTYNNMLNYAMTHHRGACYHYATFLHYMLTKSGISNTIIWGRNPQGGTHVWNQLSNGYIVDACNGYYMITQAQMRAKGFTW